jgi:hypothetical protein
MRETVVVNALAIRDTSAHVSDPENYAKENQSKGLVIIENGLNQTVAVTLQGKANNGTIWQTVATAVDVTTGAAGHVAVPIEEPWPLLRVSMTCAVQPASGTVSVYLSRVSN